MLANICAYLPAITASSPIYEDVMGENVDNRLNFYRLNQMEVPSVTGDVVPEYVNSLGEYKQKIIGKYSADMAAAGANKLILCRDWVNSRGVIFRFDRKALEVRVMDEQECVKSDVALSCFIRAILRGMIHDEEFEFLPHEILVSDFENVVRDGLSAMVQHHRGRTARQVCQYLFALAEQNASKEERNYLPIVKRRIEEGSLSEIIRKRVEKKRQKTGFREAVVSVYSQLIKSLIANDPYF
jgi:hypothetical protein